MLFKNHSLNCLIVDDDIVNANIVRRFLSAHPHFNVSVTDSIRRTRWQLESERFDILLLSSQLSDGSALEVLQHLGEEGPFVILMSDDRHCEAEVFKYPVIGYLVKPIVQADFDKLIHKISKLLSINQRNQDDEVVTFRSARSTVKLHLQSILYLQAQKDYIAVQTLEGAYLVHSTMKEMIEKLCPEKFLRVNRSFIVALHHVDTIKSDRVFIRNQDFHIGVTYKKKVRQQLKSLI